MSDLNNRIFGLPLIFLDDISPKLKKELYENLKTRDLTALINANNKETRVLGYLISERYLSYLEETLKEYNLMIASISGGAPIDEIYLDAAND